MPCLFHPGFFAQGRFHAEETVNQELVFPTEVDCRGRFDAGSANTVDQTASHDRIWAIDTAIARGAAQSGEIREAFADRGCCSMCKEEGGVWFRRETIRS